MRQQQFPKKAVCIKLFQSTGSGVGFQRYANVLDIVPFALIADNGVIALLKTVGNGTGEYYFYDDFTQPAHPNGRDIARTHFWEYFKEIT